MTNAEPPFFCSFPVPCDLIRDRENRIGMVISCVLPFETPKTWRDKWINGQGRCIQGNHTDDTHNGDLGYAFDFKLRPGTKVLAARPGVVVALCSHYGEGGMKRSLRPRANFVALRHEDGTYTRYVHLLHNGVSVRLGQEVAAGEAVGLSGATGFTSGPHLHFDAVNVLPQETSEVWVVHPEVVRLPSVAAIFSGPLHREAEDFATAPLVYLSPDALLECSSARSNGHCGAPEPDSTASMLPLLIGYPEVVVLIDRGGAGGEQTFAEAAATAADVVGSVLLPPRQGIVGGGGGGGSGRCCRCVGVIIANNQPGQEVFPMAPHSTNGEKGVRAPYPVVMISQESGQLLRGSLAPMSPSPPAGYPATAPRFGAVWGAPAGVVEPPFSRFPGYLGGNHAGWGGGRRVVVSLAAADHCPTPAAPAAAAAAAATGASSCGGSSPASSASSAVSYGEEDQDVKGIQFPTAASAGDGYGRAPVIGYPFPHVGGGYAFGSTGPPLSYYSYTSQSNTGNCCGESETDSRGAGRGAADETAGEWKLKDMLYRAKTLPVRFSRSIW